MVQIDGLAVADSASCAAPVQNGCMTAKLPTSPSLALSVPTGLSQEERNLGDLINEPAVDLDGLLRSVLPKNNVANTASSTSTAMDAETVARDVLQDLAELGNQKLAGQGYLSVAELIELGFTKKAITEFLTDITEDENYSGEIRNDAQEIQSPRPYSPSRSPYSHAKYYSLDAVADAMKNPVLVAWLTKTKQRRESLAVDKQKMISSAMGAMITINESSRTGKVPLMQIMSRAVESWNRIYSQIIPTELQDVVAEFNKQVLVPEDQLPSPLSPYSPAIDGTMLNRIHVVSTRAIRNTMTNYKDVANSFARQPASKETELILRIKTSRLIMTTYPQLTKASEYVFFSDSPSAWTGLTQESARLHREQIPEATFHKLRELKLRRESLSSK